MRERVSGRWQAWSVIEGEMLITSHLVLVDLWWRGAHEHSQKGRRRYLFMYHIFRDTHTHTQRCQQSASLVVTQLLAG